MVHYLLTSKSMLKKLTKHTNMNLFLQKWHLKRSPRQSFRCTEDDTVITVGDSALCVTTTKHPPAGQEVEAGDIDGPHPVWAQAIMCACILVFNKNVWNV